MSDSDSDDSGKSDRDDDDDDYNMHFGGHGGEDRHKLDADQPDDGSRRRGSDGIDSDGGGDSDRDSFESAEEGGQQNNASAGLPKASIEEQEDAVLQMLAARRGMP